ncbi:hypothetical protein [uncultured Vagococcus sp.]|uniref:hypothetical protein n=1 Tax=uncultured Vagococcus sp. TaxID=189676 RepID=UPI0028D3DB0F|nr:hypothetical protein [uncultured Vagococcus sp.]
MDVGEMKKVGKWRTALHLSSLGYLLIVFTMVINQQAFFEKIVARYFKLNVGSIIVFFSSDDWLTSLTRQFKLMGNDMVILIIVELVIIILGLAVIGYLFWALRKRDGWRLSDKLVGLGYLFLVISMVIILTKMSLNTYHTYETINQRLSRLSVNELAGIRDYLQELVRQTDLSLDSLIPSGLDLIGQIKGFINKTKAIAGIPQLIDSTWQSLLVLKNWLIGCGVLAVMVILVGHVMEGITHLKVYQQAKTRLSRTKASRQIELNERLVEVAEQQAALLLLLMDQKEEDSESGELKG